jgi:predicted ArsR family transcriptional regulator
VGPERRYGAGPGATEETPEGAIDPGDTAVTQETVASRLLRILSERPGNWTIEELVAELRASKTAIRTALADLEEAGNIQIDEGD